LDRDFAGFASQINGREVHLNAILVAQIRAVKNYRKNGDKEVFRYGVNVE
jgi:hypothetical protein